MDNTTRTLLNQVRILMASGQTETSRELELTHTFQDPKNWIKEAKSYNLSHRFTDTLRLERSVLAENPGLSLVDHQSLLVLGNTARTKLWMHQEVLDRAGFFMEGIRVAPALNRQRAASLAALCRYSEAVDANARLYAEGDQGCFDRVFEIIRRSKDASLVELFKTSILHQNVRLSAAQTALFASLTLLLDRGDARGALLYLENSDSGLIPRQFIKFATPLAMQLNDFEKMDDLLLLMEADLQQNGVESPAEIYGFINKYLKTTGNIVALGALFDVLNTSTLPHRADIALPWLRLKRELFHDKEVRIAAEKLLTAFPEHLGVWFVYLETLARLNDSQALADAKQVLRERVPSVSYQECLIKAGHTTWSGHDLCPLIKHVVCASDGTVRASVLNSIYRVSIAKQELEECIAPVDLPFGSIEWLWMHNLKQKCTNYRRLSDCKARPESFATLTEICSNEKQHFHSAMKTVHDKAQSNAVDTYASQWFIDQSAHLKALEARCDQNYLYTNESFTEAISLADVLADRMERKIPTSVVRIGDGEGHFVNHALDFGHANKTDQHYLQQKWWSETRLTGARGEDILRQFRKSVGLASMLGVAPYWRLMMETMKGAQFDRSSRGIAKSFDAVEKLDLEGKTLISSHFHQDLDSWQVWSKILTFAGELSWISCHDLKSYMEDTHGVSTRKSIRIPPQHSFASMFNETRRARFSSAETLFDRHEMICERIKPNPGELWLISAGFLGKIYCDIVRDRGGIGIDVGSVTDYWMGYQTRVYKPDDKSIFSLKPSLFRDPPRVLANPKTPRPIPDGC
jgi:hypothetical protein